MSKLTRRALLAGSAVAALAANAHPAAAEAPPAGAATPGIYRYTPPLGSHEYVVTTASGAPVRLFGWVAQNHSGITYETLGINGAKAGLMLRILCHG